MLVFMQLTGWRSREHLQDLFRNSISASMWHQASYTTCWQRAKEGLQFAAGLYCWTTAAPGSNEDFVHCCWTGRDAALEKNAGTGWEACLSLHLSGRGSAVFAYVLLLLYLWGRTDETNPPKRGSFFVSQLRSKPDSLPLIVTDML